MLWCQGVQNIGPFNHKLKSALTCTVWSQRMPFPDKQTKRQTDGRTNITAITRRLVLTVGQNSERTWIREFELDVLSQLPRPNRATSVRRNGRWRVTRRLDDRPRVVWNESQSKRSLRRLEVTGFARSTAGKRWRWLRGNARGSRILAARTGSYGRGTWSPAEHAVAARRKGGGAVDGGHVGTP